jgi:hypothetical protein
MIHFRCFRYPVKPGRSKKKIEKRSGVGPPYRQRFLRKKGSIMRVFEAYIALFVVKISATATIGADL